MAPSFAIHFIYPCLYFPNLITNYDQIERQILKEWLKRVYIFISNTRADKENTKEDVSGKKKSNFSFNEM